MMSVVRVWFCVILVMFLCFLLSEILGSRIYFLILICFLFCYNARASRQHQDLLDLPMGPRLLVDQAAPQGLWPHGVRRARQAQE